MLGEVRPRKEGLNLYELRHDSPEETALRQRVKHLQRGDVERTSINKKFLYDLRYVAQMLKA